MKEKILALLKDGLNRDAVIHYLRDSGYDEQEIKIVIADMGEQIFIAEQEARKKERKTGLIFLIIGILLIARGALPLGNETLFLGLGFFNIIVALFMLFRNS